MKNIERTGLYQSSEIAEIFGLAERHLWPLLKAGTLRGRKIGKHWFCVGGDILEFVSNGNQTDTAHSRSAWQPADKAQAANRLRKHLAPTPSALPTGQPADRAAVTAHASDIPTTERQRRVNAVKAAYAATDDYSRAADLLNQQIDEGGPRPERADTWSASVVRQMLARLK